MAFGPADLSMSFLRVTRATRCLSMTISKSLSPGRGHSRARRTQEPCETRLQDRIRQEALACASCGDRVEHCDYPMTS